MRKFDLAFRQKQLIISLKLLYLRCFYCLFRWEYIACIGRMQFSGQMFVQNQTILQVETCFQVQQYGK